jgi:hypothetical protein
MRIRFNIGGIKSFKEVKGVFEFLLKDVESLLRIGETAHTGSKLIRRCVCSAATKLLMAC